jgi:iron(III) transport system substrate-binding protein
MKHLIASLVVVVLGLFAGCDSKSESGPGTSESTSQTIVLYTSIDKQVLPPIIEEFEKRTGIKVQVRGDVEGNKTAGLVERLRAEKDNPQCDVYWGNEIFHTINLASEGLLIPYQSPAAAEVPDLYKAPNHLWASVGLRARVLVVHDADPTPDIKSVLDLAKPEYKGKVAIGRPALGTIAGHVASLWTVLGEEKTRAYFQSLRENEIKLLGGNGPVSDQVGAGALIAGLTDNDDVTNTQRENGKAIAVYPDQDTFGTLLIPTTVALVKGARNEAAAKQLIDYLLSKEVEQKMLDVQFLAFSVRTPPESMNVKAMNIDYTQTAKRMPQVVRETINILEGR